MFGLYATTGRAASFLAPGLFALFSGLFSDRVGIVGIALVLLAGALLLARSRHQDKQIRRLRIACITNSWYGSGGTYRPSRELNHSGVGNVRKR